jgi:hypothetical protein
MEMRRIVLLLASMALTVIFGSGVALADSPTTKEDCKKGGYAKYGFKNQGQCIEAVKLSSEPVLDASNPNAFVPSLDMTAYDALFTTCSDCWWVQTFTAEHSGTIPYVYVPVAYATTGPIPVRLLEIAPDNTTTVLAETTVQWSGECSGVAACTALKADFANSPQVSAGSRYGVAISAEGNLQVKETYGDPYTGGQSQLLEGGTFQRTWEGNIADLIFAVYVTPST